jgi:hypothetical protein
MSTLQPWWPLWHRDWRVIGCSGLSKEEFRLSSVPTVVFRNAAARAWAGMVAGRAAISSIQRFKAGYWARSCD